MVDKLALNPNINPVVVSTESRVTSLDVQRPPDGVAVSVTVSPTQMAVTVEVITAPGVTTIVMVVSLLQPEAVVPVTV
jgi:hypothetical protein